MSDSPISCAEDICVTTRGQADYLKKMLFFDGIAQLCYVNLRVGGISKN